MIRRKLSIINNKVLETPEFIPSLTSIKRYDNYINLLYYLTSQKITHFMISAYDLYYLKPDIPTEIFNQISNSNGLFFMDSGGFEIHTGVFSKNWNKDLLTQTAKEINPDIVVSLDTINIDPKNSFLEDLSNYNNMRNKLKEEQQFYEIVIHGRHFSTIKSFLNNLEIDRKLLAICIPERNLGNSFDIRYDKLKNILHLIKKEYGFEELLFHLMGCSHPLLIKKYSALGVELFDGIHWQDSLFNPSKTDFTDLSRLMDIDCSCQYCNKLRDIRKINKKEFENLYMYYTLSHNLFHFKVLMKNIRSGQT